MCHISPRWVQNRLFTLCGLLAVLSLIQSSVVAQSTSAVGLVSRVAVDTPQMRSAKKNCLKRSLRLSRTTRCSRVRFCLWTSTTALARSQDRSNTDSHESWIAVVPTFKGRCWTDSSPRGVRQAAIRLRPARTESIRSSSAWRRCGVGSMPIRLWEVAWSLTVTMRGSGNGVNLKLRGRRDTAERNEAIQDKCTAIMLLMPVWIDRSMRRGRTRGRSSHRRPSRPRCRLFRPT